MSQNDGPVRNNVGRRLRVNSEIAAPRVFLVGADGVPQGEVAIAEALRRASERGCDLIEVRPGANPPVCRLGKWVDAEDSGPPRVEAEPRTLWVPIGVTETDFRMKIAHGRRFLADGGALEVVVPVTEPGNRAAAELILGRAMEALSGFARPGTAKRNKTELTVVFSPVPSVENRGDMA